MGRKDGLLIRFLFKKNAFRYYILWREMAKKNRWTWVYFESISKYIIRWLQTKDNFDKTDAFQ